jgi:hypothetical protein
VRLRSDGDGAVGVVFRYRDALNHYRFTVDRAANRTRLVRVVAGLASVLSDVPGSFGPGNDFDVTVVAVGSDIKAFVDGSRRAHAVDGGVPDGRVGLFTSANDGVRFARVEVLRPAADDHALFRDRFSAGDLSAWSFVDETAVEGPSSWAVTGGELRQTSNIGEQPYDETALTQPGTLAIAGDPGWADVVLSTSVTSDDDDAIGLVVRYVDAANHYRLSIDRQRPRRRLVKKIGGAVTVLWEDRTPYEVGRRYDLSLVAVGPRIAGYLDGVPMFTVVDHDLAGGRVGLYSWHNAASRFSRVQVHHARRAAQPTLLQDAFARLDPSRWAVVDQGTEAGPSKWSVTGGELVQTAAIHDAAAAAAAPAKLGTLLVAGDPTWNDYQCSARVVSDTDGAIGVVFRYEDPTNWYRFSFEGAGGYRRLVRCVAGAVTTLWEDAVVTTVGREYTVTVRCDGPALQVFVDGTRVAAAHDASIPAGAVGLYCHANTGARFREVAVTSPVWTTFYRFSGEVTHQAGTTFAVHSGRPTSPVPASDVEHRFRSAGDEPASSDLPGNGATLRLAGPGEASGHTRAFRPASEYTPVAFTVLRRRDGTAAFLVPQTSIEGSDARLRFTFRRDNRALDPAGLVLKKAGSSSAEIVELDVPSGATD